MELIWTVIPVVRILYLLFPYKLGKCPPPNKDNMRKKKKKNYL